MRYDLVECLLVTSSLSFIVVNIDFIQVLIVIDYYLCILVVMEIYLINN